MSHTEIRATLAEILEDVVGVARTDVSDEKHLVDDLDVDSLSMVEIVVTIEERLGVKLPDEMVPELRTVGDLVTYLDGARVAA